MGTRPSKQFEETKKSTNAIVWEFVETIKHLDRIKIELKPGRLTQSSVLKGLHIPETGCLTEYEASVVNLTTLLLETLKKWESFDEENKSKIVHVFEKYDKSKFINASEIEIDTLATALGYFLK